MRLGAHLDQALLPEEDLHVAGAVRQQRQQGVQAGAGQQPVLHISLQLGQQDSARIPLLRGLPGLPRHQAQDLQARHSCQCWLRLKPARSNPAWCLAQISDQIKFR